MPLLALPPPAPPARLVKRHFRLRAALPPIIGAAFVTDLGRITDYTGLTGFAIAFIFPAVLALSADRWCSALRLDLSTPLRTAFDASLYQYITLAFGLALTAFVSASLFLMS